jgi:uncharacterized membrane protein YkoI
MPVRTLARALGRAAAVASLLTALSAGVAHAQQAVKVDVPDSLAAQAKVDEATARKTALARVPKGTIQAVELEREGKHLQYSYDVKVPGRAGITEVNVDALTGAVIGVQHEGAKTEAAEAASEAKKPNP